MEFSCAIGDETVGGVPYEEIVETARKYIASLGGFEKFADMTIFDVFIYRASLCVLQGSPDSKSVVSITKT